MSKTTRPYDLMVRHLCNKNERLDKIGSLTVTKAVILLLGVIQIGLIVVWLLTGQLT